MSPWESVMGPIYGVLCGVQLLFTVPEYFNPVPTVAVRPANVCKNDIKSISLTLHQSIQNNRSNSLIRTQIYTSCRGKLQENTSRWGYMQKRSEQDSNSRGNTRTPNWQCDFKTSAKMYDQQSQQTTYRVGENVWHLPDRGSVSRLYKELQALENNRAKLPTSKWANEACKQVPGEET